MPQKYKFPGGRVPGGSKMGHRVRAEYQASRVLQSLARMKLADPVAKSMAIPSPPPSQAQDLAPVAEAGGHTVAGQLFMMDPEVSAMIGQASESAKIEAFEDELEEYRDSGMYDDFTVPIKVGRGLDSYDEDQTDSNMGYMDRDTGIIEINLAYNPAGEVHYSKVRQDNQGNYSVRKGDVKFFKNVDGDSYATDFK
jgi:hypothetical protein